MKRPTTRSISALSMVGAASVALFSAIAAPPPAPATPAAAPAPGPATPFTAQAADGAALYAQNCAACHGASLEGGAGVVLNGLTFASRWSGQTIAQLHQTIATTMPMRNPASLTRDQYYAITAFLLSKNGQSTGGPRLDEATASAPMQFNATSTRAGGDFPLLVSSACQPRMPPLPQAAGTWTATTAPAGPTDADVVRPAAGDWLTYNRDLSGQRYSPLGQINAANAGKLHPVCAYQFGTTGRYETSPVVFGGVMYVTALGKTVALDAATCKVRWEHEYVSDEPTLIVVNRGVALYMGAVYRTTPSGHLIALDAATGKLLWDARVSSARKGNLLSAAPVAYDGKIFMAEAGADWGAAGHLYAFDAKTGKRLWTFNFIPQKGEPGFETWAGGTASGGGSSWSSFAIDPEHKLVYAPVGNPAPSLDSAPRGVGAANLYTNSVVAVNIATGKLGWYAQQIPNDTHDWDTAAAPMLFSQGGHDYMAAGSKNGYLYVYDRASTRLVNRMEATTHLADDQPTTPDFVKTCPGILGGIEWNGPAYSPADHALYVGAVDWCGEFRRAPQPHVEAAIYSGGTFRFAPPEQASGWVRGFDAATGRPLWSYHATSPVVAGVTPTAGGLVLTGDMDGNFLALDSKSGQLLYSFNTGGAVGGGITSYAVDGRQYVAVPSGNTSRTMWKRNGAATLFVFAVDK